MVEQGWYTDPTGEHELRWFDGVRWTEHVRSATAPPVAGPHDPLEGRHDPETPVQEPVTRAHAAHASVFEPVTQVHEPMVRSQGTPAAERVPAHLAGRPTTLGVDQGYPAVPTVGWGLLVAYAVLLIAGMVLPFASANGGTAEPLVSDLEGALPTLAIAGGALVAALVGRRGYDVGPALGGGAVAVFSVIVAMIAPLLKALIDFGNAFGGSFEPGPGLLCLGAAMVVGLFVAVPVVRSVAGSARVHQLPPLLAWAGAGGSTLFIWGVTRTHPGQSLLTGDLYVDSVILSLAAVVIVPTILLVTVRTASSAALLAGVLLFPAVSWLQSSLSGAAGISFTRAVGAEEIGIGLTVALSACALGVFGYATRSVQTPEGVSSVPARNMGAATVVVLIVAIAGLVGLSEASSDDVYVDWGGTTDGFTGDGAPPECVDAWVYEYEPPGYCYGY